MIGALALDNEALAAELTAGAKAAGDFGDPATEDLSWNASVFSRRMHGCSKRCWPAKLRQERRSSGERNIDIAVAKGS